jgi:hypothetical protein
MTPRSNDPDVSLGPAVGEIWDTREELLLASAVNGMARRAGRKITRPGDHGREGKLIEVARGITFWRRGISDPNAYKACVL